MRRGWTRSSFLFVLVVAVGAMGAGVTRSATTAYPGHNGRIVFNDQRGRLVLVNPDGTGLVQLARTEAADQVIGAAFSPDGKTIAYSKNGNSDPDIFVISP